jgi:methyl-accepting chemotaxis protein
MKNISLRLKIASGYGALIIIASLLGIMAIWNMKKVETQSNMLANEYVPEVDVAVELRGAANRLMYEMRGYGFTEEKKFYENAQKEIKAVEAALEKGRVLDAKSPNLKKLKGQLEAAQKEVTKYKSLMQQTVDTNAKIAENRKILDASAAKYIANSSEFLAGQNEKFKTDLGKIKEKKAWEIMERLSKINIINDIIDLGNATRIGAFKSQALRSPEIMENALMNFPKIDNKFEGLKAITRSAEDIESINEVKAGSDAYRAAMIDFLDNWKFLQEIGTQRGETGQLVIEACKTLANAGMTATDRIAKNAVSSLSAASIIMIIGLITALVVGVILAFFITLSITKPINTIAYGMDEGANQVASAAGQVSSASQSLAEGSSEQAASIEETSSSMEEMSSMTKKNAENAIHANNLMQEANQVVKTADAAMDKMIASMEDISKASAETQKIIKTIDEIAFQTNLLALNAAVEAARAGEAGAGFAVVADEVRNLAMRAADAAKNTSELIKDTMQKVGDGSELVTSTNEAFSQVAVSAGKVGQLVAEIAEASNEQSNGIEQVNTAVNEMDKVVQQNAANAEESASASEEMSAQAETLKEYVEELVTLVTGKKDGEQNNSVRSSVRNFGKTPVVAQERSKKTLLSQTTEVKPDQVIPFDDDDHFENF